MKMRVYPWLLAVALSMAACAQTTQINLSHDLIRLGIAKQNLTPNTPTQDARPLFQAALKYAGKNQTQLITADQGAYYFLTPQYADRYLEIDNFNNLTIDLQGSDLYLANSFLMWFVAIDSNHITLTDFTLDIQNLPFTQVQLTGVSGRNLTYTTLPNWPSPTAFNSAKLSDGTQPDLFAMVFRNGSLIPQTNRLPINWPLSGNTLKVTAQDSPWTQPAVLQNYQPGDMVVLTARGGDAPILIEGGDSNVVAHVDVYSSSSFGIHFDTTSNSRVVGARVLPRPGTDRLISTNADGIHFSFTLAGNRVLSCYVGRTMDDGIAMNSPFLAIVNQQNSQQQIQVTRNFLAIFPNGLNVQFVSTTTGQIVSSAHIASQDPPYADPPAGAGPVTLTLDRNLGTLPSGYGMIYGDTANRGAGSTIEGNTIEDVLAARGIYLGGVAGVTVQRNTIRRTNCGAIVAHEDLSSYPVGPVQDIQILSNTIQNAIGPAAVGTGAVAAIGSVFVLTTDSNFNPVTSTPNSNVTIANNTILDSGRDGIWVGNTSSGSVQGNQVIGYYEHPELAVWGINSQFQAQLLQDFKQAIVIRGSPGVTLGSNP
jgi:parallel beta-helix repeat protein